MTYTYYVTIGVVTTEVHPLGLLDTSLIDEQKDNQAFYRRRFSGVLTFCDLAGSADFTLLIAADPCAKITFLIQRELVDYWEGYFSLSTGKIDRDKCTIEVNPLPDDVYEPIIINTDVQYNVLQYTDEVTTRALHGISDVTYTRNRWLYDVIEYLADKIKTGVTLSSTFFTAATNPATLTANKLLYLTIAQKSDIIRPGASNGATELMMSWNSLMEILWGMFQVKWEYIAATDTINLEHISFFTKSAGLDLRTQEIAAGFNNYTYVKDKMPKYEKFSFMESFNTDFVGVAIYYDSKCVDQDESSNTKEVSVLVTTDLQYIINSPTEINDEGAVILCNEFYDGTYWVRISTGALSNESMLNNHLSWANLQNSYFRHNRVLISGTMNNLPITFWTAQKNMQQDTFAIVCPADSFDPADEITTELGETYLSSVKATVKTADLNPNGEMKLSLLYGPAANTNTGVTESKGIYIEQTGDDTFVCTLTEPAPVGNITLDLYAIIYDAVASEICSGVLTPETWTIEAGNRNDSFTLTLCTPIPAGGCIEIFIDSTGAPDWVIDFRTDYAKYCIVL